MDDQEKANKEYSERLTQARLHILPISLADYKVKTGRSIEDVTLETINGFSDKWSQYLNSPVNSALLDLYSKMQKNGIEYAVCLQIQLVCKPIPQNDSADYSPWAAQVTAVGLKQKTMGESNGGI